MCECEIKLNYSVRFHHVQSHGSEQIGKQHSATKGQKDIYIRAPKLLFCVNFGYDLVFGVK